MANITLSTLQNALKRYYPTDEMTNQLYNMTPLMSQLDKKVKTIENTGEGLIAREPIKTKYNASAGSVAEGGVVPVGRTPSYLQLQIGVAYSYGTVKNFAAYVSNCIRNITLNSVKPFITAIVKGNTERTYGSGLCLV